MKTFAILLLSKKTFTIRSCSILASFFRKLLPKATFERKLSSVSLPLQTPNLRCGCRLVRKFSVTFSHLLRHADYTRRV